MFFFRHLWLVCNYLEHLDNTSHSRTFATVEKFIVDAWDESDVGNEWIISDTIGDK